MVVVIVVVYGCGGGSTSAYANKLNGIQQKIAGLCFIIFPFVYCSYVYAALYLKLFTFHKERY
jgi:hypothetical protein